MDEVELELVQRFTACAWAWTGRRGWHLAHSVRTDVLELASTRLILMVAIAMK